MPLSESNAKQDSAPSVADLTASSRALVLSARVATARLERSSTQVLRAVDSWTLANTA